MPFVRLYGQAYNDRLKSGLYILKESKGSAGRTGHGNQQSRKQALIPKRWSAEASIPRRHVHHVSLDKGLLRAFSYVGRFDGKFIVGLLKGSMQTSLLVLLDQHAIHERIRLESMVQSIQRGNMMVLDGTTEMSGSIGQTCNRHPRAHQGTNQGQCGPTTGARKNGRG